MPQIKAQIAQPDKIGAPGACSLAGSQKATTFNEVTAGGLFHCTPLRNLKLILESGAIYPNQGQFPSNHSLSPRSRCRSVGGISLWDLTIGDRRGNCFFTWISESRCTIKLKRDAVASQLVNLENHEYRGMYLRGENCCAAPIPVSSFAGYLLLGLPGSGAFAYLEAGTDFKVIEAEAERLLIPGSGAQVDTAATKDEWGNPPPPETPTPMPEEAETEATLAELAKAAEGREWMRQRLQQVLQERADRNSQSCPPRGT